jgi:dihydrofolate synthase / folylpolyglutamate synthase
MTNLPHLARLDGLGIRGMKLGLAAIDALCERLGRPERKVVSVLVAGTNGKGSAAATLAAIAGQAGLATGLYTSPHLIDVTERIRLGPDDITPQELDDVLAEVFAAADRAPEVPVTYFEAMTAAALAVFARRGLDLSILEAGLGGRLDATNVAPASVSVVTSISLDHVEDLGGTVAAIAAEKAGIFRAGRPALVESSLEPVREAFRSAAGRVGARLHEMEGETRLTGVEATLEATRFRLATPVREYVLETPLLGAHQARNAATAVRAAELLKPDLSAGTIARGVASVRWPGRLERFRVRGATVLLDGCHNADGALALRRFLSEVRVAPDLIFGAMADKDVEAMAAALGPAVTRIRLVPAASPRAASPEELARRFADARPDAAPAESLEAALEEFLVRPTAETIIIAGSLYLVGEARAALLSGRFDSQGAEKGCEA